MAADLNLYQPHQVRKKRALKWRYRGLAEAGYKIIATDNLRIDELGNDLDPKAAQEEQFGTNQRVNAGRFSEDPMM